MSARTMWMVRAGEGGRLIDEFLEDGIVAIGWSEIGDLKPYREKNAILDAVAKMWPAWSAGKVMASASQLIRFRDEIEKGDRVITYDASQRTYHVGTIASDYKYDTDSIPEYGNVREVRWNAELDRDNLSVGSRNSLGSTLTLFRVPDSAVEEIERLLKGAPSVLDISEQASTLLVEEESGLLERYRDEAFEIIKDRVNRLAWQELQELVAGLLRAMGYKTRIAPSGSDRGVDIMASPDGFGFESPRIIVEVKHRSQAMGSQEIRSFLGGRHKDDKGLYVSTGGFSKDARYEAERASIPVMLMDINDLVKAVLRSYEKMDMETQKLLPLKKIYWPV